MRSELLKSSNWMSVMIRSDKVSNWSFRRLLTRLFPLRDFFPASRADSLLNGIYVILCYLYNE